MQFPEALLKHPERRWVLNIHRGELFSIRLQHNIKAHTVHGRQRSQSRMCSVAATMRSMACLLSKSPDIPCNVCLFRTSALAHALRAATAPELAGLRWDQIDPRQARFTSRVARMVRLQLIPSEAELRALRSRKRPQDEMSPYLFALRRRAR